MQWLIVILAAAIAWFFLASMTREENEHEDRERTSSLRHDRETMRYQPVRSNRDENRYQHQGEQLSMTTDDDISMHTDESGPNLDLGLGRTADYTSAFGASYDGNYNPGDDAADPYDDNHNEQFMSGSENRSSDHQRLPNYQWRSRREGRNNRHDLMNNRERDQRSDDRVHIDYPDDPIPTSLTVDVPSGLEFSDWQQGINGAAMSPTDFAPGSYLGGTINMGVPTFSSAYPVNTLGMLQVNNEDIPRLDSYLQYSDSFDPRTGGPTPYDDVFNRAQDNSDDNDDDRPPTWSPS